jgi:predicted nucleotidyltransferase
MVPFQQIKAYADEVGRRFHPQKIILFGSHAYGRPTADSDVDLLVIMPFNPRAGRKSLEIRQAIRAGFPLDLLVRHPKVLQRRLQRGDVFLEEITRKGRVLYEG